jgi:hypothetical protein
MKLCLPSRNMTSEGKQSFISPHNKAKNYLLYRNYTHNNKTFVSHISIGRCPREIWLFSGEQIFISPLCKGNKCIISAAVFPHGDPHRKYTKCCIHKQLHKLNKSRVNKFSYLPYAREMNVLFYQANVLVNSAKWNRLAIFVYKIIISEHLWSYLY